MLELYGQPKPSQGLVKSEAGTDQGTTKGQPLAGPGRSRGPAQVEPSPSQSPAKAQSDFARAGVAGYGDFSRAVRGRTWRFCQSGVGVMNCFHKKVGDEIYRHFPGVPNGPF